MAEKIPAEGECLELLKRHNVPEHIIEHSREVTRVSTFLAKELNKAGESLDIKLIRAASLLHDMAKYHCIQHKHYGNHDEVGADLLRAEGYPKIAEIIEQHVALKGFKPAGKLTEAEIVNYADKRVMHTKIVSLGERFKDIKERYGNMYADSICSTEKQSYTLEKKIFSRLGMKPEELSSLVK